MQLGYGNDELAETMARQARNMTYCSPFSEANSTSAQLAHAISERTPGDLNRVFFTTGGSTAVDTALRFAHFRNNVLGRPGKKKIISRKAAYHGGTYLAASVSGKTIDNPWLDTDREICHLLPDVNPFRRPQHMNVEAFCTQKVADLEQAIVELGAENVAAFIAEPLLASGGVVVPPRGYHKGCLEICRKYDVLYISDEVVTGFGRLGHWFASHDIYGIVPDIITCAKGMTAGYAPMGAAIFSDSLFTEIEANGVAGVRFESGFTYSGHPVCAAAGLKTIEIFERDRVLEHVRHIIPHFQVRLRQLIDLPLVVDVRGDGLVGCIECALPGMGSADESFNDKIGAAIDDQCQQLGLMVRPYANMCVFSPPLIITHRQIDDMFDLLVRGVEIATEDLLTNGLQAIDGVRRD